MRTIKVQDKKLLNLLNSKKDIVEEGRELSAKLEEVENRFKTAVEEIHGYVGKKIFPKMELGEFEEIGEIKPDGDDISIDILDMVEEFKKQYEEKKKKTEEQANKK